VNEATLEKATSKPAPYVGYSRLLVEVHVAVRKSIPRGRTVLVVSRGDEQFVRLEGRRGWHFPRHEDGRWGGFHPADSQAAIDHLEELRSKGAQYLVFPETALWWLDFYGEFAKHLDGRYRVLEKSENCVIYDITVGRVQGEDDGEPPTAGGSRSPAAEVIDRLLPAGATLAVLSEHGGDLAALEGQAVIAFRPGPDDRSAIDGLRELRTRGAEYLVVPRAAFDWLDDHVDFAQHLRERHRFVTRQQYLCEIYELVDASRE
jgi:hypothetical protein